MKFLKHHPEARMGESFYCSQAQDVNLQGLTSFQMSKLKQFSLNSLIQLAMGSLTTKIHSKVIIIICAESLITVKEALTCG